MNTHNNNPGLYLAFKLEYAAKLRDCDSTAARCGKIDLNEGERTTARKTSNNAEDICEIPNDAQQGGSAVYQYMQSR